MPHCHPRSTDVILTTFLGQENQNWSCQVTSRNATAENKTIAVDLRCRAKSEAVLWEARATTKHPRRLPPKCYVQQRLPMLTSDI